MLKKIINLNSAYAQLVTLVFVPISVLALVGGYLVEKEASKAVLSEQRMLATAILIRYEPIIAQMLPTLIEHHELASEMTKYSEPTNVSQRHSKGNKGTMAFEDVEQLEETQSLENIKNHIQTILASMSHDQHIQRLIIFNESDQTVVATSDADVLSFDSTDAFATTDANQDFIFGVPSAAGTSYGHLLGVYQNDEYWLFIEIDDEPLIIARLRVWLALGLTGLFTLLVLLMSLNIYAKRWIAPIYDLRLHLRRINADNMYQPVNTLASGELNQLQQEVVRTLRRLYADFQDLKDHAHQTEGDLRDAFDEMEMQNILIRDARDQAISSSQAKSAFLANISHELRTPLNSIDGFINLLARDSNLTAEQDMYVQTICKSSAHLLALVNDVLDFSKIEAGKLVLDQHEFSLYAAIYDVMDMLSPLAAEKGLRMAVMYYNDVPNIIIGDALRVKQVLTNLVGNAIKFTDVGEVVVRVSIDEIEDGEVTTHATDNTTVHGQDTELDQAEWSDSGMIHIAVQDTGSGVSDTAKAQMFKSFSQGDPSITRQYGGTGLGLVISKQLTRLMGGRIGFYDSAQQSNDTVVRSRTPSTASLAQTHQSESGITSPTHKASGQTKTGATFWFSIPAYVPISLLLLDEDGLNTEDADLRTSKTRKTDTIPATAFVSHQQTDESSATRYIEVPVLYPFTSSQQSLRAFADAQPDATILYPPIDILVWINHTAARQVFNAAIQPLNIAVSTAYSLVGALEKLKEEGSRWDWVVIDSGDDTTHEDSVALLKQIRLHYQGKLAIYGYQVALDTTLLQRYKASGLYQPLDKRQLYHLLDSRADYKAETVPAPMWQGISVLVVDDHLPNLLVLDALLSELGITVVTANSGFDAIDKVAKHLGCFEQANDQSILSTTITDDTSTLETITESEDATIDLIFMDLQMPRMSGEEATQKIRQLEQEAYDTTQAANVPAGLKRGLKDARAEMTTQPMRIPIIALTAHGLSDEKERMIAAGFDDYVGKPISRPQLLQVLQHWLGRNFVVAAATSSTAAPPSHNITNAIDQTETEGNKSIIGADHVIGLDSAEKQENSDPALPIVDWHDALVRSANKPDLAKQLLMMMQEAVEGDVKDLKQAWQQRDREQLAQIAHRILGASRYTGVPQIRHSSQHFEDKCLLNISHTIPSQFTMLKPYYEQLINSLLALQNVELQSFVDQQIDYSPNDTTDLSENDMTWKMI